jgi:hypothetical protein
MQAPFFYSVSLDPFGLFDDRFCAAEAGIGRCDVFEALVIALPVVVFDERLDLGFKVDWQIIILQQDSVLRALCHRSILP